MGSKKKSTVCVCSCMFVKLGTDITTVLNENGKPECIRFEGEISRKLDESFWEDWVNAVSYESGYKADFCFICDELPELPEKLAQAVCTAEESSWTPQVISEALIQAHVRRRLIAKNSKGYVVADQTIYFPDEPALEVMAVFPKANDYAPFIKEEKKPKADKKAKTTPASATVSAEKPDAAKPKPAIPFPDDGQTELARHFTEKLKEDEKRRNS